MKPIINIVYYIQYLTISLILDLQENIYTKVKNTYYMSAGVLGLKYRCFPGGAKSKI